MPLKARLVGLSRFELLTPRLSSVCSNQLSYRPNTTDPCPDPDPIFRTRNVRQGRLAAPSVDCPEGALERWADSLKTRQNVNKPSLPGRRSRRNGPQPVPDRSEELSTAVEERSRKEVIQPQVLLQLPCYDFTPITNHTLGTCLPCGLAQLLLVQPAFVM